MMNSNNEYKPLTIQDMIHIRLDEYIKQYNPGNKGISIYALNEKVKAKYNTMVESLNNSKRVDEDILIIDITGWLKIGKTINGRRADKLKEFCKQYENAAVAVIVYNDTNPTQQVVEVVRGLLPELRLQHFSTCNNVAGKNRALWFMRPPKKKEEETSHV